MLGFARYSKGFGRLLRTGLGGPKGPEPDKPSPPSAPSLSRCDNCARLNAERLKLDKRIHNQRMALRDNWQIVEMRSDFVLRRKCPSRLLDYALKQNRVIQELRNALQERVVKEKGQHYRVIRVRKLERKRFAVED